MNFHLHLQVSIIIYTYRVIIFQLKFGFLSLRCINTEIGVKPSGKKVEMMDYSL